MLEPAGHWLGGNHQLARVVIVVVVDDLLMDPNNEIKIIINERQLKFSSPRHICIVDSAK